jgi:hypothetical protein
MKTRTALIALLGLIAFPALARADDKPSAPPPNAFVPRVPEVIFSAGVRATAIPSKGFEAYADNHFLLQSSFSVGLTFLRKGAFSASASFEWDAGGKSTITRGQELDLFAHRLAIPIEARWEPNKHFALFVKAAPGGDRLLVSSDPSLRARAWSFGLDATGGAALMLGRARRARFWLTAEGGYAFAFPAAMHLTTQPGEDDPPRRYGSTSLPDLQLGGGLARLGAAVSF